jgi:hypothetical protein
MSYECRLCGDSITKKLKSKRQGVRMAKTLIEKKIDAYKRSKLIPLPVPKVFDLFLEFTALVKLDKKLTELIEESDRR